ncbi:hypothetical protein BG000_007423 [Podila horticola]|nr:hypothetical protein BG000_007423 [Podila horticola]
MLGPGPDAGPGPGPAPPPSLTLPPLRELDKIARPDDDRMGRSGPHQPRSQASDPHLHQHSSSLNSSNPPRSSLQGGASGVGGHYQSQVHRHGPGSSFYQADHHSRYSSSVGSLPDLYMSSTSAPSTTTTSSLSRADSLSTMEYLQQGALHGHNHRHLSSAGSTTSGSTSGSSFGNSVNGGPSNPYNSHQYQYSTGLGRANLNAAVHQHQQQQQRPQSTGTDNTTAANGKVGSSSSSAGTEQGRNSTKRAAQNRAAQRAFRQRKDLYVRELERKAEALQVAEGKIMHQSERIRMLEAKIVALSGQPPPPPPPPQQQQQGSPQSPPEAHPSPSPVTSAPASFAHNVPLTAAQHTIKEWEGEQDTMGLRSHATRSHPHDQESYDSFPTTRPSLGRHSSSQQLRVAYNNSSSPPLANGLKLMSSINKHSIHRRPDLEHEEGFREQHDTGHSQLYRYLHRHPSEPSLKLARTVAGTRPAPSSANGGGGGSVSDSGDEAILGRANIGRSGSMDSRMEMTSPVFNRSGLLNHSFPLPPFKSEHGHSPNSYASQQQPPSSQHPLQERPPLYPIATQGLGSNASNTPTPGARTPVLPNPSQNRSWSSHDEGSAQLSVSPNPISPSPRPSTGARGGMAYSPGRRDGEYASEEHSIRKQASWNSLSEHPSRSGLGYSSGGRLSLPSREKGSVDMDMKDTTPQYHPHHRGSASSASGREPSIEQRRSSGTEGRSMSMMMVTDSPEMTSNEQFQGPRPNLQDHHQRHYHSQYPSRSPDLPYPSSTEGAYHHQQPQQQPQTQQQSAQPPQFSRETYYSSEYHNKTHEYSGSPPDHPQRSDVEPGYAWKHTYHPNERRGSDMGEEYHQQQQQQHRFKHEPMESTMGSP